MGIYGGYEQELVQFEVIAHSKNMVFRINGERKERVGTSREDLYVYTPELERKFTELLKRGQTLREEIVEVCRTAKRLI